VLLSPLPHGVDRERPKVHCNEQKAQFVGSKPFKKGVLQLFCGLSGSDGRWCTNVGITPLVSSGRDVVPASAVAAKPGAKTVKNGQVISIDETRLVVYPRLSSGIVAPHTWHR